MSGFYAGFGLKNKVVVVTGGGQGIGLATAVAFAEQGARVLIADLPHSEGSRSADFWHTYGYDVAYYPLDVTSSDQTNALFRDVVPKAYGQGVDVLVNSAGITADSQLVKFDSDKEVASEMSDEQMSSVIGVNLVGSMLCTKAALPCMVKRGEGVVLFASSLIGTEGGFGQSNYAATKAGVVAFMKSVAREVGRHGVRSNAVAPGYIDTDMMKTVPQKVLDRLTQAPRLGVWVSGEKLPTPMSFWHRTWRATSPEQFWRSTAVRGSPETVRHKNKRRAERPLTPSLVIQLTQV